MQITAAMVKELRERTGAGMMECKKALVESDGDMDAAVEHMRKSGLAKADKKASRIAAEGIIVAAVTEDAKAAALVEVNCETDFVSKGDNFHDFARSVVARVLKDAPATVDALSRLTIADDSTQDIESVRQALVAKIGENIQIRRFERMICEEGRIGMYLHGSRIGVLVNIKGAGADEMLAKDISMHIAASRPICVLEDEVPQEILKKEREIFTAQAETSGKPANIIEKMVAGRLKKFIAEATLYGQAFVKDPNKIVGKLLKEANAEVVSFIRFEVGEGIEKKTEDFAQEVMAQVKGSS